jgi:hypothetical protein
MNWRIPWLLATAVNAGLLSGCVERRYVVTSDPPGAIVLRNNEQIGATPVDDHFVYYGNYHFTLIKDGYQTLQVDQEICAPWYQYIPLDFFSENLVPWRVVDVRRFHYQLQPLQAVNSDDLLNRAQALRNRGQSIATSAPPPPAGPLPPPPGSP